MRTPFKVLAAVAVMAILSACGADPGTTVPDTPTNTTISATSTTDVVPTTNPVPTTPVDDPVQEAVSLFDQWVGALAEGESDRAWDLMAPSSQKALGSFERFVTMSSGFAEGWGAWVAVEDPSYHLEEDEAGRTLLIASGTIRPEGQKERREVGVPLVGENGRLLLSPFEEFGNVADGLEEEASGSDHPPVPADSGEGRRIVYSNSDQRVWLVEEDGTVTDTYPVSGKKGVPAPGSYEVFSKSELAYAGYNDITMTHMVRFAHGTTLAIGFHAIPNDGNGRPIQAEEDLGEYHSAGCVRQSPGHAAALYEWADIGTPVVVLD